MRRMRYIRLTAVLLLTACGDGGSSPTAPPTPPAPVATSVTVSPTSLLFASLGDAQQLSATVKDQNGATMSGATVTWTTSAASVAMLSSAGLLTSVADGSATITATSGSASATATVSVAQVAATLWLSDSALTFNSLADPLVAVIVAVPSATEVTRPVLDTVATASFDVAHVMDGLGIVAPFASVTVAVSWVVSVREANVSVESDKDTAAAT